MGKELDRFERSLQRHLKTFLEPKDTPRQPAPACPAADGITVHLGVRKSRLSPDHLFVHHTNTISRLDARLQAERAAKEAGWPIIGYVVDYQ